MHTYIICGGNKDSRNNWITQKLVDWQTNSFDVVEIQSNSQSLGISEVRDFEKQILLKPLSSNMTVGIIRHADLMTIEAQQAILKTLEEPPPHVNILLEVSNPELLLTTIVSRSVLIQITSSYAEKSSEFDELIMILQKPTSQRLVNGEIIGKTKAEALTWIETILETGRHYFISLCQEKSLDSLSIRKIAMILRNAEIAHKRVRANVTPRLVIDEFLLTAPQFQL